MSEQEDVRLLIVDDHEMVAEGFANALGRTEGIVVVATANSVAEARSAAEQATFDVALVDFRLPDGTGVDAANAIREGSPETAVIIITAFSNPEIVAQAIEARCVGFLSKNESLTELRHAVIAAAAGETLFNQELLAGLVQRLRSPGPQVGSDLTIRELEVLRLLAKGLTTDAIAEELYISRHTARNHIQNVLMKLDAHSKLEAVTIAMREGLVVVEDLRDESGNP